MLNICSIVLSALLGLVEYSFYSGNCAPKSLYIKNEVCWLIKMKSHVLGLLPLLVILSVAVAVVPALAVSSVTAIPNSIGTNGDTQFKIECVTASTTDVVVSISVTDPLGHTVNYIGSLPINVPYGSPVYVGYGSSYLANWSPVSGSNPQLTSVSGKYHVVVLYEDESRNSGEFDCSAFFNVPEFAIGSTAVTALGFAGLTLMRRRSKK